MATEREQTDKTFLADLARGGFAESLSPRQRRDIHIETPLDGFLDEHLEAGHQIVLTGNPGDGKTQHIFIEQGRFPPEEGYYYLTDASEYADYGELLAEWNDAYEAGKPGILAINDGPLYAMATQYQSTYPFLEKVRDQLENQVVYSDEEVADDLFDDVVVVDLNNRNVLVPDIIDEAIEQFAGEFALGGHDHSGRCHIQYNAEKLANERDVRTNLRELLISVGEVDEHVTIRDLINFICYLITAGDNECQTNGEERDRFYNLAFTGEGKLFDLIRQHFDPEQLTHPFIDSALWARAEDIVDPKDTDDAREEIQAEFLRRKREFLFAASDVDLNRGGTDVEYRSRDLYRNINRDFLSERNGNLSNEARLERLIKRINGYFVPGSTNRSELGLWMSHRYRSRSSLALISRTEVPKHELTLRRPRLHDAVGPAISYTPAHFVLEYTDADDPVRLRIDQSLHRTLSALDSTVPYTLRNRDEEQQLLEFMEEVEYYETYSEEQGSVSVKDTEAGDIVRLEIENDRYRI